MMKRPHKVLTLFGTRPEVIKLAPVIRQLESQASFCETINVTSAQHTDLLYPLASFFGIRIDHDLNVMRPGQTPNQVCSLVLSALDRILLCEEPALLLVQGDTSTALSGALAAFHRNVPVAHVEAGLRSGNDRNPYPEEMNRMLITRLASFHFAATNGNRDTLLREGVEPHSIFVTGNPVVDSLLEILDAAVMSASVRSLLNKTRGLKRLILTTHRRESFGHTMAQNLRALRKFIEAHEDIALIFPVHPNPAVCAPAQDILSGHRRIILTKPLEYEDFIILLRNAWLIVSDSGGVQEEAPTLGKPLLILRENTERPEVLESGIARLVGGQVETLTRMLEEAYSDEGWNQRVRRVANPFGSGDSGARIAGIIEEILTGNTSLTADKAEIDGNLMRDIAG